MTTYPVTYLVYFAYAVLRFLVNFLIDLVRYPLRLVLYPFKLLAYFEVSKKPVITYHGWCSLFPFQAVLIFITAAVCIGIALGCLLYLTTHYTVEWFNQWMRFVLRHSSAHRHLEDYRNWDSDTTAQEPRRLAQTGEFRPKVAKSKKYSGPRGASGHSASTIMEEEEESSSAYFDD